MTVVTSHGQDQLAGTAHSICTVISQWREKGASSNSEFLRIDASVRVKANELIYSIYQNHDQPLKRCLAGVLDSGSEKKPTRSCDERLSTTDERSLSFVAPDHENNASAPSTKGPL